MGSSNSIYPENGRTVTAERPADQDVPLDWSLLSAQGRVLFYIALCPDCSVQEISKALSLTERAVWGIIRELRNRRMVTMRRENRRHRYSVNLDAPLLHPTIHGLTLRPVLGKLVEQSRLEPNEACERIN